MNCNRCGCEYDPKTKEYAWRSNYCSTECFLGKKKKPEMLGYLQIYCHNHDMITKELFDKNGRITIAKDEPNDTNGNLVILLIELYGLSNGTYVCMGNKKYYKPIIKCNDNEFHIDYDLNIYEGKS